MPKTKKKLDKSTKEDKAQPGSSSHTTDKFYERLSFSHLAMLFLLYVALPSFTLSAFLLLRIGTPQSAYWISMALLGGIIFHYRNRLGVGDYLAFFGILVICHTYAYFCIDLSTDGLAYHQPAVRRIAGGFNPIYDGYINLERPPDIWSDQATYFPKAIWYFSAAATAAFGDIQIGKVYNPLLILAALFFVLDAVKKEHLAQRALWVIACLNPIALTQMPYTLADGALSSLVTISICYAYTFFVGTSLSRLQHLFCVIALAMLFCVKTSGFGYGCIVILFIALHSLVKKYRERPSQSAIKRFSAACKTALQQGLRLGIPVVLLVLVWGFAPYATNILNGRNIFYPLIYDGNDRGGFVQAETEKSAKAVYPDAYNRFSRLLCSIASHTMLDTQAAKIKNPLDVSLADWKAFGQSYHVRAAGLGPLFCLLLLLSVPAPFLFRLRGNGWLLCMLLTLVFIQPYSWLMRFAPFLWILPLACLMSIPEKRRVFLWVTLSIAIINSFGVSYFAINTAWKYSLSFRQICSHFAGEIVMLPQTIYEYAGAFDRYDIKKKYINPEEINHIASRAQGVGWGLLAGPRIVNGVNVFLKRDLLPLPEATLVFSEEAASPWLRMSEGLMPSSRQHGAQGTKWVSNSNKVKFYMSMDKEPKEDWELRLKGFMFDDWRSSRQKLDVLVYINNREIGTWQIDRVDNDTRSATFTIPLALLAESFKDETHLVTLMLRLRGVTSLPGQRSGYGIQLEEMRIRPKVFSRETFHKQGPADADAFSYCSLL